MKKINFRAGSKTAAPGKKERDARSGTSPVEYAMVTNMVMQQYSDNDTIRFDALLSIPVTERIPALMEAYGKKTMHRSLVMILKEFVAAMGLPAYKRPTETTISVTACEIMLSAHEDFLAVEDVILFLQRAQAGFYGPIKSLAGMHPLLHLLDNFRQERHAFYVHFRNGQNEAFRHMGPVHRSAPQPTALNDLLQEGLVIDMNKKMSG